MAIKLNAKGQAVVESLLTGALIWIALKFTFYMIIYFWMQLWCSYNLYESLICRESLRTSTECQKLFQKKFKKGQFLFKVDEVKWKKSFTHQSVSLTVEDILGFKHKYFKKIKVSGGRL